MKNTTTEAASSTPIAMLNVRCFGVFGGVLVAIAGTRDVTRRDVV